MTTVSFCKYRTRGIRLDRFLFLNSDYHSAAMRSSCAAPFCRRRESQKSRSVIRGLKAGNSVLIITPGVPCVIADSCLSSSTNGFGSTILPEYVMCLIYDGKWQETRSPHSTVVSMLLPQWTCLSVTQMHVQRYGSILSSPCPPLRYLPGKKWEKHYSNSRHRY